MYIDLLLENACLRLGTHDVIDDVNFAQCRHCFGSFSCLMIVACGCSGSNSFDAMDDDRACLSRQPVLQKMPTSH